MWSALRSTECAVRSVKISGATDNFAGHQTNRQYGGFKAPKK